MGEKDGIRRKGEKEEIWQSGENRLEFFPRLEKKAFFVVSCIAGKLTMEG